MTRLLLILAVLVIIFALVWPRIHHRVSIRDVDDIVIENQRLTDDGWQSIDAVQAAIEGQWSIVAALVDMAGAVRR